MWEVLYTYGHLHGHNITQYLVYHLKLLILHVTQIPYHLLLEGVMSFWSRGVPALRDIFALLFCTSAFFYWWSQWLGSRGLPTSLKGPPDYNFCHVVDHWLCTYSTRNDTLWNVGCIPVVMDCMALWHDRFDKSLEVKEIRLHKGWHSQKDIHTLGGREDQWDWLILISNWYK
jgi:hypothetical protein